MAWTYSGDPATSNRDAVRFHMQDTDIDRPLLSDEEVDYLIAQWYVSYGSLILVAAVGCEIVAGKYAGQVTVSADGVSVSVGELQGKYDTLAASLRDQYKLEQAASPMLEGVMHDLVSDPTIEPLRFGIGFTDNIRVGRQDYGNYDPGNWPGVPYPEDPAWYPTGSGG